MENYKQRFGEPTPYFYVGSLEDALRLACHKPAKEVQAQTTSQSRLYIYLIYYLFYSANYWPFTCITARVYSQMYSVIISWKTKPLYRHLGRILCSTVGTWPTRAIRICKLIKIWLKFSRLNYNKLFCLSRFLSSLTACINSNASLTARNIKLDKLPAIMLVGKSRLMGRQTCEVLSVIHGKLNMSILAWSCTSLYILSRR